MGNKFSDNDKQCIQEDITSSDESKDSGSFIEDGHVLRLCAESYRLNVTCGSVSWEKVGKFGWFNATRIPNHPKMVVHITACNLEEKVLDIAIEQPGTVFHHLMDTNNFVYWKNPDGSIRWALSFGSARDAKQFINYCSSSKPKLAKTKVGKKLTKKNGDQFDVFGQTVAAKLRRLHELSAKEEACVEIKILEVIQDAEAPFL